MRIAVSRSGGGLGRVALAAAGTATRGRDYSGLPGFVDFTQPAGALGIDLRIRDDRRDEPTETIELGLERPEGALHVGEPGRLEITIADDDLRVRVRRWRVRGGAVLVRVRARGRGQLRARAIAVGSSRTLATARARARRAGTVTLRLRLTRAGQRALSGSRRARARVVVDYTRGSERRRGVQRGTLR